MCEFISPRNIHAYHGYCSAQMHTLAKRENCILQICTVSVPLFKIAHSRILFPALDTLNQMTVFMFPKKISTLYL